MRKKKKKTRRYKAEKRLSARGFPLAQLASCCASLWNFNLNHLQFVRRHVYSFLISQLKGSASDPLVYLIRAKIWRLFVLVCSRKKKKSPSQTRTAPLGSCQYCNYLHHFDALQGLRRERASPPQTQFDRQDTSWGALRMWTDPHARVSNRGVC